MVKQLNSNERVSLADSLLAGTRYASEKYLKDAIEEYTTCMDKLKLPIKWDELTKHHNEIYDTCFTKLKSKLVGNENMIKLYLEKYFRF